MLHSPELTGIAIAETYHDPDATEILRGVPVGRFNRLDRAIEAVDDAEPGRPTGHGARRIVAAISAGMPRSRRSSGMAIISRSLRGRSRG
jgi:hypothetical protein